MQVTEIDKLKAAAFNAFAAYLASEKPREYTEMEKRRFALFLRTLHPEIPPAELLRNVESMIRHIKDVQESPMRKNNMRREEEEIIALFAQSRSTDEGLGYE